MLTALGQVRGALDVGDLVMTTRPTTPDRRRPQRRPPARFKPLSYRHDDRFRSPPEVRSPAHVLAQVADRVRAVPERADDPHMDVNIERPIAPG